MNSWFKLAIFSLIGIIIGSFALNLMTPQNGVITNAGGFQFNANYQMPMNDNDGFQYGMRGMRGVGNMGQGMMNNGMGGR